jgi:hypothetical protein
MGETSLIPIVLEPNQEQQIDEIETNEIKEEIPVIPTRPTKLTYTKPNVSIDRL